MSRAAARLVGQRKRGCVIWVGLRPGGRALLLDGNARGVSPCAGILFRDQKAIGKLCSPRFTLTPLEDASGSPEDGAASSAVQQCSLAFDSWVPAGSGASQQPLRLPVDSEFKQSELSVQVRGARFSGCCRRCCVAQGSEWPGRPGSVAARSPQHCPPRCRS